MMNCFVRKHYQSTTLVCNLVIGTRRSLKLDELSQQILLPTKIIMGVLKTVFLHVLLNNTSCINTGQSIKCRIESIIGAVNRGSIPGESSQRL